MNHLYSFGLEDLPQLVSITKEPAGVECHIRVPVRKEGESECVGTVEARFMVQWDHDSSRWDVFLIEAEDGPCEETMADLVTSAAYLWMTHAIELEPRYYLPSV